ncbi:hypothetical protein Bhyg_16059, partial [Pseudolycoriella hygida]
KSRGVLGRSVVDFSRKSNPGKTSGLLARESLLGRLRKSLICVGTVVVVRSGLKNADADVKTMKLCLKELEQHKVGVLDKAVEPDMDDQRELQLAYRHALDMELGDLPVYQLDKAVELDMDDRPVRQLVCQHELDTERDDLQALDDRQLPKFHMRTSKILEPKIVGNEKFRLHNGKEMLGARYGVQQ